MFDRDLLILIVQIIAALGVVISVVYLGLQIRQQNIITKEQRGIIFDRNNNILAMSLPSKTLCINPSKLYTLEHKSDLKKIFRSD